MYELNYIGVDIRTLWALGALYSQRRHLNTDEEIECRLVAHWAPFVNVAVNDGWINVDEPEATAILRSEDLTREMLEESLVAMGLHADSGRFVGNAFVEW